MTYLESYVANAETILLAFALTSLLVLIIWILCLFLYLALIIAKDKLDYHYKKMLHICLFDSRQGESK